MYIDDDASSYCGSFSGEAYSSKRRRAPCRLHSVDSLSRRLKDEGALSDWASVSTYRHEPAPRLNKLFHYYRYVVIMFAGLSVGIMFVLRYGITVAILKMVNQTALYLDEHPEKTLEDFEAEGLPSGGDFNWNNEIQHAIMSWYMIAYTLPQITFTKFALRIGSRFTTALALTICATSNLLIPIISYYGWQYVVVLRLINGMGAASVIPMMINLVEKWVPYEDFTLGLTTAQVVITIMTCVNPIATGYLCTIHWSYAFYVPAVAAIIFALMWLIFITDNPETNRFVSQDELDYICCCRRQDYIESNPSKGNDKTGKNNTVAVNVAKTNNDDDAQMDQYQPNSWSDVFFLPQFYAYNIIWCLFCSTMSAFTFILPSYLRQFLKIPVDRNGIYCAIIQTGGIVSAIWPHPILKMLQKTGLGITMSRKITYLLLCLWCAATWWAVGTLHTYQLVLLWLNRCVHGGNDIIVTGTLMSNFAKANMSSFVFSMVNTFGNFAVVPLAALVGWILDFTGSSTTGWTYVFQILAGLQIIMLILFTIFINSDPVKFKKNKSDGINEKEQPHDRHVQQSTLNRSLRDQSRRSKLTDISEATK